jgi:minor extracellular serine protease Vpr
MRYRVVVATALVALVTLSLPAVAATDRGQHDLRREGGLLPAGWKPAVLSMNKAGRYFVQLEEPSVVDRGSLGGSEQRRALASVLRSQDAAIAQAESLGGTVVFRYGRLVNGFSAELSRQAALAMAARSDVALVERVSVIRRTLTSSAPFIGAPKTWKKVGVRGRGVTVAVIDTGVDYTHADFGGPGTVEAFAGNDPAVIEPGTFPTAKVVGGFDFVGDQGYDPGDADPTNDVPSPDPDPLDLEGHGTHVAGICCGRGVPGSVGPGIAPRARILALKVFDIGSTTSDVVLAAYEYALDPNQDGNTRDAVSVINLSLGDDYVVNRTEERALRGLDRAGVVVVAAAGNAGNQPSGGSAYIAGSPGNAPTAIGVASSIDQLEANVLTVDDPAASLPEGGVAVVQDWAGSLDADLPGALVDARASDSPSAPDGTPSPADRLLCDSTPTGTPFAGKIALVFKGSTGAGDCDGSEKVYRAQQAGAVAVILWSGFTGPPFALGPGAFADQVSVPAAMVSTSDGAALGDLVSPNAPSSYNTVEANVTIHSTPSVVPGFGDRVSDFSSEGPARISSRLKPDVTAPGDAITSAAAGTGTGGVTFGGTSMATPHIAGVAALLRELHPTWTPARIKALLMNQATNALSNADGSSPVPATVQGAGRVRAYRSATTTNLAMPGSVSFGLQGVSDYTTVVRRVRVWNLDDRPHRYEVTTDVRYTDFPSRFASVRVSVNDEQLGKRQRFRLAPGASASVFLELALDPSAVPRWQQQYGWYYFSPGVDGDVKFRQLDGGGDRFHVPWHAAALATSATRARPGALDLTGGPAELRVTDRGAGATFADLYQLGGTSPKTTGLEEDIAAIGARSFTGSSIDGVAEGAPTGVDPLAGLTWIEFLTFEDEPTEPVEFVVAGHGVRNTTETVEVDILVDVGADGVVADPQIGADALVVKLPFTGVTCLFTLPSDFTACDGVYFPDYSNYNASVIGLAVDASALGLTDAKPALSYGAVVCSGNLTPDAPEGECDVLADIGPGGTYAARLNATDPALVFSRQVVGGFWRGGSGPVTVSAGSAAAGADPSILVVLPNNAPATQHRVIGTTT